MDLLLFRHGIAEDLTPDLDDALRPLTKAGVARTKQAARGLARIISRPDVILTSPKVRALATAQILGKVLKREPEIFDQIALDAPLALLRKIAERPEKSILLVGHEPTFSELIERLISNGTPRGAIELRKAGCALLKVTFNEKHEPQFTQLAWLATPKMLRAAGR
jgi:phosphohistidine phosphatase